MADSVNFRFNFDGLVRGRKFDAGNVREVVNVPLSDDYLSDDTIGVAAAAIIDIFAYDSVNTPIGDFTAIIVIPDGDDIYLEMICDQQAITGTMPFAIKLRRGIPFIIPTNTAKADYTAEFAGGSDEPIEIVRVTNEGLTTSDLRVIVMR